MYWHAICLLFTVGGNIVISCCLVKFPTSCVCVLNVSCLSVSQPGECNSYHESVHMARTVREDVLRLKKSTVRHSSVTLVTQLDSRRLERLVTLAGLWKGNTCV